MNCYVDGNWRTEQNFWREIQSITTEHQRQLLLEGYVVRIGGREFQIVMTEDDDEVTDDFMW